MEYSSKDFHKISDKFRSEIPNRLIHKEVLKSSNVDQKEFSLNRNHVVKIVDLPTRTISMTIGELKPGESSRKHRHNYESVIYIIEGNGRTIVEGISIFWEKGDAIYIPPWAWHQHTNLGEITHCLYLACENAPMLQNLGNIAVREES